MALIGHKRSIKDIYEFFISFCEDRENPTFKCLQFDYIPQVAPCFPAPRELKPSFSTLQYKICQALEEFQFV